MSQLKSICTICYEHFVPETISALPCGHTFHCGCILNWLKTSGTCPECRVISEESGLIRKLYFKDDGCSFRASSQIFDGEVVTRNVMELKEELQRERNAHAETNETLLKLNKKNDRLAASVMREKKAHAKTVEILREVKEDNQQYAALVREWKEKARLEQKAHARTTEALDKLKEEKEQLAASVREPKGKIRRHAPKPLKRCTKAKTRPSDS